MTHPIIPTVTDDQLAEIEAEARSNDLREDGQLDGTGAADNAETMSLIRRLRESEARLWSLCVAVTQKDVERVKRETCNNLDYLRGHAAGGD